MRERPILFNSEMVRAVLDGRKTQTRRVVNPQPSDSHERSDRQSHIFKEEVQDGHGIFTYTMGEEEAFRCPYGKPGDQLWVRETFTLIPDDIDYPEDVGVYYRADGMEFTKGERNAGLKWKPSIFMPRDYSRIQLEITSIDVERVWDISEMDAVSEGVSKKAPGMGPTPTAQGRFSKLWDSINRDRGFGWDTNPWVWVVEFCQIGGKL